MIPALTAPEWELAEAVQIHPGVLLLILAMMAAFVLAGIAFFVLGFVWAARAGRGSRAATYGFGVVLAVEGISFLGAALDSGLAAALPALVVMATQFAVYFRARRHAANAPAAAPPATEPPPPSPYDIL